MTTSSDAPAAPGDDMFATVAEYLRKHPEFFDRNTELLRDLAIPHPSGEAVSLVERQLAALRDENLRLKRRFEQLVAMAQANEKLNSRVHELALDLMAASGPQSIFTILRDRLRSGFRADDVAVRIFAEASFVDSETNPVFVGRNSSKRGPYAQMLDAAKPLCGRLTKLQSNALFDLQEMQGSAVVLPLRGKRWDGLLGVRSNDPMRFEPDMGTEILTYLADVTTLIIDPWVAHKKK